MTGIIVAASLLLGAFPAPGAEPAMSSGPPSEVRLEDRIASGADRSIEVPVYVREASRVDGLELMMDLEGEYLEYAESAVVDPDWSIERIAQYEQRRLIIALRKDPASRIADKEKLILKMTFNLRYAVPGAPPFRVDTALSLGTQSDPPNSGSTHFYRVERGERRPMPTVLESAMVTIYHQDGIEIGWGDLTVAAQDFTLPVYLTYLRDDRNVFGVGIDYDELFLRVLGVEGISPPLASEEIEQVVHEGRGRTTFELILDNGMKGPFTRLHVANLFVRYNGVRPPDGQMLIRARLFDGDIAAAVSPDDGDGGGASYGSSIPGVLTILPDHFVRGNVDSSMTFGPGGRIVPAPDLSDAMLLLDALFKGRRTILCDDAADTNDSGQVEVSDVVHLLNHFFRGGPPPSAPYPFPGPDSDAPDNLDCEKPLAVFNAR